MKAKITSACMAAAFLIMGVFSHGFAQQAKDEENGNPNFRYIDNWDFYPNPNYNPEDPTSPEFLTLGISLWWRPQGANQTVGVIPIQDIDNPYTYREHETEIVNPQTGSTGSMKLAFIWDEDVEWFEPTPAGSQSHFIRQYMPPSNANVSARQFQTGQALEVFIHGDGSGNRFRFMTRDGAIPAQLEGSPWITLDWVGWKRITWDFNRPENVVGWISGNGEMNIGNPFYFDSFHITRNKEGASPDGVIYFDDFRIVDPFAINFNIAGADGSEVISIRNTSFDQLQSGFTFNAETFDAGVTEFDLFPGTFQYFVQKDGFVTAVGTFEVDDADLAIDVTLNTGDDPEFNVTFTIIGADEQILNDATITIGEQTLTAAPYVFQLTPGFYNYTVSRELYFDTEGSFTVTDGNLFVNVTLEEIPDVVDRIFLSWDVAPSASTPTFRQEHYSVYVASVTPGQAFNPADYVKVFEETLSTTHPNWTYQNRSVDISAYQQQNIRVAFRHHDSEDNDRLVIDNVKITGVAEGDDDMVLLHEDFTGGIPTGFDPEAPVYDEEWLPAGWLAVDADNDGFNWYFAIRVDQDLNVTAHMRSQSYDPEEQEALDPDNWLVTPTIQMPWVFFFNVAFDVKDEQGAALANAIITLDGVEYPAGQYTFSLANGTYTYQVSKEDYVTATGTFTVANEAKTVEVTMALIPLYDVTFNVNMNQAAGFEPGVTNVYLTGSFFEWAVPGSIAESQLNPTDNVFIFTRTLQLPAGTYEYKYFNGPSFDNGEWAGGANRVVVVTDNMEVNDVFGVPTSVNEVNAAQVAMFPNPARQQVTITSDSRISQVTIFNLAGQQVYNQQVNDLTHTLRLDGFNHGIYMVRILTDQGAQTRKLQLVK